MIDLSGLKPKAYSLTPDGVRELQTHLDELRRRRRQAAEEIKDIASQSTDAGSRIDSTFAANRNQGEDIDTEISLCERIIAMAKVIDTPQRADTVQFGSRVALQINGNANAREYRIVGILETDPANGKISHESPIGRSLLGRRAGDEVDIAGPNGSHSIARIFSVA